jgi:hypothetical protein
MGVALRLPWGPAIWYTLLYYEGNLALTLDQIINRV